MEQFGLSSTPNIWENANFKPIKLNMEVVDTYFDWKISFFKQRNQLDIVTGGQMGLLSQNNGC